MGELGLTAGAAARRLGVAVTTLRSWHERYGLGPSEHEPPHHRRYSSVDMSRLDIMRRLTSQGVAAAEAARVALADEPPARASPAGPVGAAEVRAAVSGLTRTATRLDPATMADAISEFLTRHGVVATWDQLVRPVVAKLGDRHQASKQAIDAEHLLSRTVSQVFSAVPRPAQAPRALLACADDEQHTLALEALGAALASLGVASRMLGARVPPEALAAAIRRTGPAVVVVWSQMPSTGDPGQLKALLAVRPRPRLVLAGGPGWDAVSVPDDIVRPADLTDALQRTAAILAEA